MNERNIIEISEKLHDLQEDLFKENMNDSTDRTRAVMSLIHKAIQEWEIR